MVRITGSNNLKELCKQSVYGLQINLAIMIDNLWKCLLIADAFLVFIVL